MTGPVCTLDACHVCACPCVSVSMVLCDFMFVSEATRLD